MRRAASFSLALVLLAPPSTAVLAATANAPSAEAASAPVIIPASAPSFGYEGRFDDTDPAARGVIWQGSRIALDFDGASLALQFDDVKGQNFFDAGLDGRTHLVELREHAPARGVTFSGLGAGRHHLVLFKRTEASAGTARFRGVELAAGAQAFAPAKPAYRLRLQFFGDSITAGACNEDGPADQWEDRRTHNNALSYGAMTAAAFAADYRNIAVSGMGVATGWTAVTAGEIWDRVYPSPSSPRADLTSWTPDVVFINLGENDDSFTIAKKQPFPAAAYTGGYVALVQAIRAAHPATQIVILRGGMFGGSQSERLRKPWEAAVARLETADPRISHFIFQHWSSNHPRVADHRAMADELIAWLREQPFMQSRSGSRD